LSYCITCNIIRPPRSFHCRTCGVCIEVHDHHCPIMGTCIGRRNIRYFVLFLVNAAGICLVTSLLCFFYYEQRGWESKGIASFVLMIYMLIFALTVGGFGLETNHRVMKNMTTNEQLRRKWNAKGVNSTVGLCAKLKYYYWLPLPESRVQEFHREDLESKSDNWQVL
jgi:palmitoyltransferase ZDHHC9/14/18